MLDKENYHPHDNIICHLGRLICHAKKYDIQLVVKFKKIVVATFWSLFRLLLELWHEHANLLFHFCQHLPNHSFFQKEGSKMSLGNTKDDHKLGLTNR